MKYEVATLEGALLDAAVFMAENNGPLSMQPCVREPVDEGGGWIVDRRGSRHAEVRAVNAYGVAAPCYSDEWEQGGPIIERERVELVCLWPDLWSANPRGLEQHGPTPLVAAMRAFVASKFGEEIEL
jgi:hypothetical protein